MPHQALTPVRQPQAPHPGQEGLGFRLNGLGQQPAGAAPQDGRPRGVDRLRLMQRDNGAIACHRRIAPSGGPGRLCHPPRYAALLTPPSPSFGHSSPRVPGTLYTMPFVTIANTSVASVPLGIARTAIDTLIEVAKAKVPVGSTDLLKDKSS